MVDIGHILMVEIRDISKVLLALNLMKKSSSGLEDQRIYLHLYIKRIDRNE